MRRDLIHWKGIRIANLIKKLGRWKMPVVPDAVFDNLKIGDLWNDNARYIDKWYATEMLDDDTIIIGEPKSPQYNLSYLIIGKNNAILYDTGTGKRNDGVQPINKVVKKYTDKPIRVILSHFHFDHTGGVDEFDGVTMIDLPYIHTKIKEGAYRVSALENAGTQRPLLKVMDWVKPNEIIDLGNRKIQFINTPGHTPESITLIDRQRKYAFTGDFMYQHLGGIVVFVPGSDHEQYIESIDALIAMTGDDYRYFGSHGLPEFDKKWLEDVGAEFKKIKQKEVNMSISVSSLAPLVPLRLHAKGQILIYFTPFLNPTRIFSWQFSLSLLFFMLFALILFWKALLTYNGT